MLITRKTGLFAEHFFIRQTGKMNIKGWPELKRWLQFVLARLFFRVLNSLFFHISVL